LMHPRGRSFRGTLVATRPGHRTGAVVAHGEARHRVTVRLSKATPTPHGWPDVFGLAIRMGVHDLLVTSSNPRPLLRHLFLPARGPATFYSSLAAYRNRRHRRVFLGARIDPDVRGATIA